MNEYEWCHRITVNKEAFVTLLIRDKNVIQNMLWRKELHCQKHIFKIK